MKKLISLFALWLIAAPAFAAHAFVQSTTHPSGSSSTTLTFTAITVNANDTLTIAFQDISTSLSPTVTTSQGDTVVAGPAGVGNSGCALYTFYVMAAHGGSTVVTIVSTDNNMYNGVVDEYSGLSAFVGSNHATPGGTAGANTIASGNISFSGAQVPGMIWAIATDNQFAHIPTAGTSPIAFTVRDTPNYAATEDGPVAASGNSQGIFSFSVSGGSVPIIALGFTDATSASPSNMFLSQ